MVSSTVRVLINILIAVNLRHANSCPQSQASGEMSKAYKFSEISEFPAPITLDKIKSRLKESEIFDWTDPSLTETEKKEMGKLFDTVEIMTTSRSRQPANVHNMFSSLRLVERVVKKQLKEKQISKSLASKFNWDKINKTVTKREPMFTLNESSNMRVFNTSN